MSDNKNADKEPYRTLSPQLADTNHNQLSYECQNPAQKLKNKCPIISGRLAELATITDSNHHKPGRPLLHSYCLTALLISDSSGMRNYVVY